MARSKVNPSEKVKSAGISLPPKLIVASQSVAGEKGKSFSAMVREMLLHMPEIARRMSPAKRAHAKTVARKRGQMLHCRA